MLAAWPACLKVADGSFRCVLASVDPDGTLLTAEGTCEGLILPSREDGRLRL
jgi:inosine/xanthosine triphosphate pyrophosphatase family protein